MAGKIIENGGVSGYYALAVVGGVLLLAAASMREKPAPKRKARKKLGKVQKAVASKRKRTARSNARKPDVALLQAKHDELNDRLRKLRAAHMGS